jgi:hypothetical protein
VGALFVEALARIPAGDVSAEFRRDLVSFIIEALCSNDQRLSPPSRRLTRVGRRPTEGRTS